MIERISAGVRVTRILACSVALLVFGACGGTAQQPESELVVSSDATLRKLASELLPDLAARSGLELREPVRLEMRSREELVRYLESKLDEELPEEEARATVEAYALFGLVPDTLDLREVLLALYTEQVAGFYEPDSTTLFVMDDQPEALLEGLLVHELVHAVQDQWIDLGALADPKLGSDRATAAQAAIEGHATLVMLEYMAEQAQGTPVDLGALPNFANLLRSQLEGARDQFPALAAAPPVIQESLLFPYLEGAGYVHGLWAQGDRVAPFGEYLPKSTEQILGGTADDVPIELAMSVSGADILHEDVLGRLELGVMLDQHLGPGSARFADGWGGDRYVLVEVGTGERGLIWYSVWDDEAARDRFVERFRDALGSLGGGASLEVMEVGGRAATVLRVGATDGVSVEVTLPGRP
ncbi:MAG: hypothetical protein MK486_02450 [Gemmatimonadetes bacterium]|jgi:hypothetical protein|nr:hypothetical protein [Gemmatimonadota bacterium]